MIITIDGVAREASRGEFVMQVAKRNNIHIPGICHHDALPGQACCRLCLVEVRRGGGAPRTVAACVYPAEEGLEVATRTESIHAHRKCVLTMIKERAPAAEGLNGFYKEYSVTADERFCTDKTNKCVMCGLCVQACKTLGASAIAAVLRGVEKKVGAPFDEAPEACVGCGSCARVCPANAIAMEEAAGKRIIWGKTFALLACESCGAAVGTKEELAMLAGRDATVKEQALLCPKCRRKHVATVL